MLGWPMFECGPVAMGLMQAALSGIVLWINRDFFSKGFSGLVHGAPNMDTLVALGAGVSYLWSWYLLIAGAEGMLYFESAAMIVTLITIGKTLEGKSKGRTTDALKSLIRLAPETAIVVRAGEVSASCEMGELSDGLVTREVEIPLDEIRVGDIVLIRPGSRVPVDAVIIEGRSEFDESALTGESVPVGKGVGDMISAATMNGNGYVKARATRVGEDTSLAQIIQLVADAAASKAPIARTADKIAGIFVPCVMAIAAIVLLIWLLLGQGFYFALTRAISVLLISCPCALGLATPVAIMVGSGVGARHGILFKTAAALEQSGRIQIVALDKTGTITQGISAQTDPDLSLGEMLSAIAREDEIRPDSAEAIAELRRMGLRTVMITGDNKKTAMAIAELAGVDEVVAEVLPGGKGAVIEELKAAGKVAMVGDGINDAPALTIADLGIAIGAGTDVALDAADVVLLNSNLSSLVDAVKLGRKTLRNIKENLFWAFFYNVLLIPLAAGAYTAVFSGWTMSPMLAAAAMSLSSFCVCMNALRLNRAL